MTNDKQRERLVELLQIGDETKRNPLRWCDDEIVESLADCLLANGVIVPPVKYGDSLYIITEVSKAIVETIVLGVWVYEESFTVLTIHGNILNDSFGKTVFLTKEEAEAKMKGGAE